MKITPIPVLFLILLLTTCCVFLSGCVYTPDDVYEIEIAPDTNPPDITVELNFDMDTVYIPAGGVTRIKHQIDGSTINWINIYIDDVLYDTNYEPDGSLELRPSHELEKYTPYTLKMEFLVPSGSGSIADTLLMEGFLYQKEWTLIIVDNDDIGSEITDFLSIDSSLLVKWTPYRCVGFKKYALIHEAWGLLSNDTIAVIYDQNVNQAFDLSFTGFEKDYFLKTYTDHGIYSKANISFEDEMPQIVARYTADNSFVFSWNKSKYSGNISGFKLFELLDSPRQGVEIAYVGKNDTSYIYENARFGVEAFYFLYPVPVKNPPVISDPQNIGHFSSSTGSVYAGDPIEPFLFFNTPLGQYCYYSPFKILKFDCITQINVDSVESSVNTVVSSPDGQYLIKASLNTFTLYDANDLSIIKQFTTEDISGLYQHTSNYTISNNGILAYYSGQLYVYNILDEEFIGAFEIPDIYTDWSRSLRISPNGDHILFRYVKSGSAGTTTALIQRNGNVFNLIWDMDVTFYQFDYLDHNFSYYDGNYLITKSLNDLSVVKQIFLDDRYVYNIDYNTLEFVTLNHARDKLKIYDYNTGNLKHEILTYEFEGHYSPYYGVHLSNKTLFSNRGFKLQMNY